MQKNQQELVRQSCKSRNSGAASIRHQWKIWTKHTHWRVTKKEAKTRSYSVLEGSEWYCWDLWLHNKTCGGRWLEPKWNTWLCWPEVSEEGVKTWKSQKKEPWGKMPNMHMNLPQIFARAQKCAFSKERQRSLVKSNSWKPEQVTRRFQLLSQEGLRLYFESCKLRGAW